MEPIEIIAQSIGILAMLFNILSYQGKKEMAIITVAVVFRLFPQFFPIFIVETMQNSKNIKNVQK